MSKAKYRSLPRRTVRYWCFRFKTEAESEDKTKAVGAPRGLRQFFENHDHFIGWKHFNESAGWDVGIKDHFTIVPLKMGSGEAWDQIVEEEARKLPGVEDGC